MAITLNLPVKAQEEKLRHLAGHMVVIKCGGNAMIDEAVKEQIIADVTALKNHGVVPIIVHGGGPMIRDLLQKVDIESEFIGGHRKTDSQTMGYVEMALSGSVNSELVSLINQTGFKAVGISGKDGKMVTARKRSHSITVDGQPQQIDLGHVGNVDRIDTTLVKLLANHDFIPVISPVAGGNDLDAYNVNADMFAGHMAGALQAAAYVALTNVDGLQRNPDDPSTLIKQITVQEAQDEIGGMIRGGMIPKVESCIIALKEGVKDAYIVNGTREHIILQTLLTDEPTGTAMREGTRN